MAASVWRGRLAFGMVSIPVRLYKAARRERIRFHHVYRPEESSEMSPPVEEADEPEPSKRGAGFTNCPSLRSLRLQSRFH